MKIKTTGNIFIFGLLLLAFLITYISLTNISKLDNINTLWTEFDLSRNDKSRMLNMLRSEIGYGGMIHHFKNYLLRRNTSDAEKVRFSIGAVKTVLQQYKQLQISTEEDEALLKISATINAYSLALAKVNVLIQQQKTSTQIDVFVRIDDKPALTALQQLESSAHKRPQETNHSRARLLSQIAETIGYGGLIHNFKNYLLRGSLDAQLKVEGDAHKITKLIKRYQAKLLTNTERNALRDILSVTRLYQSKALEIKELKSNNTRIRTIDSRVYIDDKAALNAFLTLKREIIHHTESGATKLHSTLAIIKVSSKVMLLTSTVAFIILIGTALYILRQQLMRPLSKLTEVMYKLSHNQLETEVYGSNKDNEFGEMARSVEVFKDNSIKRLQAEEALKIANQSLEEKVLQRTRSLKKNEEKLARQTNEAVNEKRRVDNIINTAMDAVIQMDEQGLILGWNKQAEQMFGWTTDEAAGLKLHELIIPEKYREMHVKGLERFVKTGEAKILNTRVEISALQQNRKEIPIELTVSAIRYEEQYYFCAFIRDITKQKQDKKEILQAKEEAETANKAKSLFLANMSHELRTPMHGILSFSNFGIKKSETAEREKLNRYFSNIQTSGKRLLNLLNDLLDLSKLESGKIELNKQETDLVAVLENCKLEQEQRIKDLSLTIQIDKPSHPVSGQFDTTRVGQVITNILSNAIKFSPEGSDILISLSKNHQDELLFSLQDSGVGIPSNELEAIFDAFIQSSKTDTSSGGTGLGLAISKKIIEEHGGKIWAENNPEGGAKFTFTLPVTV